MDKLKMRPSEIHGPAPNLQYIKINDWERKQKAKQSKEMVQCVMCPWGKCSEDCPTLDVLPFEGPLKEENVRKGQKLQACGRKIKDIKESLKVAGDVDAKNELINKWVEEFDSRDKGPLFHIIKNRILLSQKQKIIDEHTKALEDGKNFLKALKAVLKTSSVVDEGAPVQGLPGLKKCTTKN
ncbi:hypothetical protein CTI12_AA285590 [Artemisia annua]|uniref:4Fe-4S ferredoxin-type domain-containing protein n=1 Tax=Artemisia annua TaxID=35608 RepID=A0A2U1NBN1_ARTAN|nr:hypothetical protein CTI12_AA285590 [Artemisia annua]